MSKDSMNRRKFLTGVAVAGASSLLLRDVAWAAEPTLEETLKWIQVKLEEYGNTGYQAGGAYRTEKFRLVEFDIRQKMVAFTRVIDIDHGGDLTYRYDFCLSDLIPKVEHEEVDKYNYYHIRVWATDYKEKIKETYLFDKRTKMLPDFTLGTRLMAEKPEDEVGHRIGKALAHAIKLSGGQPHGVKTNEPF